MNCYNCGCNLSEHDFCTACGVDVSLYKKIMHVSNMYYNDGLEKAGVRDLTGAVASLRQSLKFNKNHIEARNLLGLIYFEMGEAVAALSEWVISKNLRPEKNIADDYINMVQSNATRLDTINQTLRKYNQAYAYCLQGSKDLAVIQLKKVLSMNPRLLQAHQLLALLYMDSEQWEKARRELTKCLAIDKNNTLALRYMKEVELVLAPDASEKSITKHKNEDAVRYQSDNEIIIQPLSVKESKGGTITSLLNIGLGIIIGLAAMFFLVMPGRIARVNNDAQTKITEIGNQLDDKNSTIQKLEKEIADLEAEAQNLQAEIDGYAGAGGMLETTDRLLAVSAEYLASKDDAATGAALEEIGASTDVTQTSEAFQKLYQSLISEVGPKLKDQYLKEGLDAYNGGDYEGAIAGLTKAVYYGGEEAEPLFRLGLAYRRNGSRDEAIAAFQKVVELYPGTQWAKESQGYMDQLSENQD